MGVDRVVAGQLLVEVLREHLDVPGLVHHLRRRVVLGVDPRNGLDDLRGADERALLAVEELRQRPVLRLHAEREPLGVAPLLERRALGVELAAERHIVLQGVGEHDVLLVDVGVPGQVGLRVPLRLLRPLVQLAERGTTAVVVPREDGVPVRLDEVLDLVHIGVGDGEDRLEVVDFVAAQDLVCAGHGRNPLRDGFGTEETGQHELAHEGAGRGFVGQIDRTCG